MRAFSESRFLTRLRPAMPAEESQRTARVLATARALLAASSLLAIYLDPTEPSRFAGLAYTLMVVYAVYSIAIMLVFRRLAEPAAAPPLLLHAVDLVWVAGITIFTEGPNSPFYLYFIFVLLAAAYRWGLPETLATAVVAISLLFAEALLLLPGHTAFAQLLAGEFQLNRLIMRATYLMLLGVLLGYLAEEEKQLRAESAVVTRLLAGIQSHAGLRPSLRAVLRELNSIYHSSAALMVTRENPTGRVFVWKCDGQQAELWFQELSVTDQTGFFFESPLAAWHLTAAAAQGGQGMITGIDVEGKMQESRPLAAASSAMFAGMKAAAVTGVDVAFGEEWTGRVMLVNPQFGSNRREELRFLQTLVRQLAPALYSVYLIRRLRSRAGAMERARVARELHDGVIQSLVSLEMQVDVLKESTVKQMPAVAADLALIKEQLRTQVTEVRELMQQMRQVEMDPRQFLEYVADMVDRFRRDTGIAAKFVTELEEISLSPRVCRELARIIQEALVNVRKHSGARNVMVRFSSADGRWMLEVDDDGRGFDFSGQWGMEELNAGRKGPVVIKERVRALEGNLAIASSPGEGARLTIAVSKAPHG